MKNEKQQDQIKKPEPEVLSLPDASHLVLVTAVLFFAMLFLGGIVDITLTDFISIFKN